MKSCVSCSCKDSLVLVPVSGFSIGIETKQSRDVIPEWRGFRRRMQSVRTLDRKDEERALKKESKLVTRGPISWKGGGYIYRYPEKPNEELSRCSNLDTEWSREKQTRV